MYEGKIIKFYRQKAKITQEELGKGICSVTHISKIERGITEYSPEITILLAKRLQIDMEEELTSLENLKIKLDDWHECIISQNQQASTRLHNELKEYKLLELSEHATYYKILVANYYLTQGCTKKAKKRIYEIQRSVEELSVYESNLFKHILALYYSSVDDYTKSIDIFNTVDFKFYANPSIYYDLAVAYQNVHSPVLAYHYAEKALHHFKKTNQFLRIIDTENLMLIQVESDQYRNFNDTIEQYANLIKLCDLCNSLEKKAKVLHNFAYEHFRRQNYETAGTLYKESMALKEKDSPLYLLSLEGYTRSALIGKFVTQEDLVALIEEGLTIADRCDETLYRLIFTLHRYSAFQQKDDYHTYLFDMVLPYLKSHGYTLTAQTYDRDLFNYYSEKGKPDKALEVAERLINMDYVKQEETLELVE
ncbi:helix-turn-helix domain-containing protein [Sporosarcina gallistercoris]|uniref:Helix-turn-helix transcriptional regulator n=1 Tax=Sporosarcina gallistercoris TaxID=2762245 RepID=A0ABR8PM97_9BACL|nr:helix-turn-helix transcriptional regulator [Sporosarcina gallistercoris]MBD7909250.1 helix-turn-helix transcriptional regulator [Sporosarcina gallistercoris]